jgi:hypothetical protein
MEEQPLNLLINVPTQFGSITLKLTSLRGTLSNDFDPSYLESGITHNWTPGVYYRGIIDGNPNSMAAVCCVLTRTN